MKLYTAKEVFVIENNNNRDFSQFAHLLHLLDVQAKELRILNNMMPKDMRVPNVWFNNLDTVSNHVQSIKNLEFFFVVLSTLDETIEYQLKLIEFTQPGIYLYSSFQNDRKKICLDATADSELYANPGIHKCKIDLAAYWDPKNGLSVDNVREQAIKYNVKLAGLAAAGAYALQDSRLYQLQDGEILPYFDIAEIRSGDDGSHALYSDWCSDDSEVCFSSYNSSSVDCSYAKPSFIREY